MTPTTTDRPRAISPLDIFGAISHMSATGDAPHQAFETLLNKPNTPEKIAFPGHPPQPRPAEQPVREADLQQEYTPKAVRAAAGKKPATKACSTDNRQRMDDDQPNDEDLAADHFSGSAASTGQSPPQAEDAKVAQAGGEDVRTRPEDPASDEKLIDTGDAAQIPLTMENQIPGLAPPLGGFAELSQPDPHAATIVTDASTGGEVRPDLPVAEPAAAGDQALSPRDYEAAVHGNGPLSLAEPGPGSSLAADAIAAIDEQTAANVVEIQPAESTGGGEGKGSDSNPHEGAPQNVIEASALENANPSTLTNQEAPSAAAPPAATGDAPPSAKEGSQPQASTAPPTGGTQPAAHKLYQNLLNRTEGQRGHSPVPVPVDARFLSRVAKAFLAAQQRDGEVRLRLSPPELGSLRLQVSVQDGVMVARMETETEAAKAQLTNNLPVLRERLAEQGIRIERFDIDLMQRPTTGTPDRPSDPEQQSQTHQLRPQRPNQASVDAPSSTAPLSNWNGQGRLNVII